MRRSVWSVLGEIHQREDEEQTLALKVNTLPENRALHIEDVSFSYDGADRDYVLEHINLAIPQHKVTAIVGASGSGKDDADQIVARVFMIRIKEISK